MFWGLVLEPAKKYTQTVKKSFHISQAVLDISSASDEPVHLILQYEGTDFILAILSKKFNAHQTSLDLNFEKGDVVAFRTCGQGKIHLTGYHVLDDEELDLEEYDESDEETHLEPIDDTPLGKKRKKVIIPNPQNKKSKVILNSSDDELESGIEQTTFDRTPDSSTLDIVTDEDDDDDDDDEDDEEEDADDVEDSELDDEEDGLEDEEFDMDSEDSDEGNDSSLNKPSSTKKGNPQNKSNTGLVNGVTPKKDKKNKSKIETPATDNKNKSKIGTPDTGKKNKSKLDTSVANKSITKLGTPGTDKKNKQSADQKKKGIAASPGQKKVLEGGVIVEEVKIGEGQVAKPGRMAQVYYTGRLKSNNKEFDSTTNGPPFKFRIGRGEVIKGWDIGVNGMKIGGTRKITIPAALAYGSKGAPPAIPPNSVLVFDIELKGLS